MIMATLTVKSRTKPDDGTVKQNPATSSRDRPAQDQGPIHQPVGDIPASCGSLREYLKTNH
jgi:hypothetical protein